MKAAIFEEVFGEFFSEMKFDKEVELVGEDLQLKRDGALMLKISSFPE